VVEILAGHDLHHLKRLEIRDERLEEKAATAGKT
jgi:hypothetical protein